MANRNYSVRSERAVPITDVVRAAEKLQEDVRYLRRQQTASWTTLLENPPTEDEAEKAPTSEWAFDHNADADAHHVAPTAGNFNHNDLASIGVDDHHARYTDAEAIAAAAVYEDAPTNGETGKAPTSNWAYDHDADISAHHVKYTDAEAQSACNLDGTLYWSCAGIAFDAQNPDTDNVDKNPAGYITASADGIVLTLSVNLPNGATVTKALVYCNLGGTAETWYLKRIIFASGGVDTMATANMGTEDTTITNPVVDNSAYGYFMSTSSIDTGDTIYAVRITYTI